MVDSYAPELELSSWEGQLGGVQVLVIIVFIVKSNLALPHDTQ